jgi:amino acid transporter
MQLAEYRRHNTTPYIAIIFLVTITLIAPWLGRTALTWIVDMSSTGVSIYYN